MRPNFKSIILLCVFVNVRTVFADQNQRFSKNIFFIFFYCAYFFVVCIPDTSSDFVEVYRTQQPVRSNFRVRCQLVRNWFIFVFMSRYYYSKTNYPFSNGLCCKPVRQMDCVETKLDLAHLGELLLGVLERGLGGGHSSVSFVDGRERRDMHGLHA